MDAITLNWHITEQCNYKCHYCFAKYTKCNMQEIHRNKENITTLLTKLYNSIGAIYNTDSLRLNIAGGEPLLSKNLGFIVESAYKLGFKISIITNASLLTKEFIESYIAIFTMFGISVDSINTETNNHIGRCSKTHNNNTAYLKDTINFLKTKNKDMQIKINTVVNRYNYKENMGEFIESIKPDKWKIFQALSINADKNYCNKTQYKYFLRTHKHLKSCITDEDKDLMTNSYIMIDPYGRFYQNTKGNNKGYTYSPILLDLADKDIANYLKVDMIKYKKRCNLV